MEPEKGEGQEQRANRLSGRLMDANGRQGTAELELPTREGGRAVWSVRLLERDGEPLEMKGEIEVEREGEELRLRAVERGQGPEWEAGLALQPAGRYAERAWVGQYRIRGEAAELPLQGGVMILWQFR